MKPGVSLSSLRVQVDILLWRRGWMLPLALAAAGVAVATALGLLVPARDQVVALRNELGWATLQRNAGRGTTSPPTESQQLQALQAALHTGEEPAQLLSRLATLAQAEQIMLAQGEYQQQFHTATQLTQVQVSQPVTASYPQLKRYIESALRTLPQASLDQIAVRRENVGQDQLQVRLRWSLWVPTASDPPASPAVAVAKPASATTDAPLSLLPREHANAISPETPTRQLFAAHSWTPPPPTAPSVPAPEPVAPALPYAFIGKKHEADRWEVYLSKGEQVFVARQGGTLEDLWRVDSIRPPTLALTYLPLGQVQSLAIGEDR